MGEYAIWNGQQIKIGTCEDMYYLRYEQLHDVEPLPGNVDPVRHVAELRFRFPWPDEDGTEPGAFGNYNRTLNVYGMGPPDGVEHGSVQFRHGSYMLSAPCPEGPDFPEGLTVHRNGGIERVLLCAQKFVPSVGLVPILRCAACHHMWREENPERIQEIAERVARMEGHEETARRILEVTPHVTT